MGGRERRREEGRGGGRNGEEGGRERAHAFGGGMRCIIL